MPETWNLRRRLTLSGGEIAYDVLGDGPPLILVHGTPSRSYIWRDVALRLADRFTVYDRRVRAPTPIHRRSRQHHLGRARRVARPHARRTSARAHPRLGPPRVAGDRAFRHGRQPARGRRSALRFLHRLWFCHLVLTTSRQQTKSAPTFLFRPRPLEKVRPLHGAARRRP